jgi:flagellar basal body-associated protein FliL
MAKKTADVKDEGAAPDVAEAPEKIKKKRKIVVLAGVGTVVLSALGVGGFFGYKAFFGQKTALSAKRDPVAEATDKLQEEEKKKHVEGDEDSPSADKKEEKNSDGEKKAAKDAHDSEGNDSHSDSKKEGHNDSKSDSKDDDKKSADKKDSEKLEESGSSSKKSAKATGDSTFGDTFEILRMDLNLGNPIENRFLRVGFSLQFFGGEAQKTELKQREAQIKDIVITIVSSRTRVELVTEKGKENLRRDLLNRLNEALDKPIKNIFFTDFLVE